MHMLVCMCLAVSSRGCRTSDLGAARLRPEANSLPLSLPSNVCNVFSLLSRGHIRVLQLLRVTTDEAVPMVSAPPSDLVA